MNVGITVKTVTIAIERYEHKYGDEIKVDFSASWMVDGKSTLSTDQFNTESEALDFAIDHMKRYGSINSQEVQ